MKQVLSLFLIVFSATTLSQELPEIVPPSPEVASFGKFSEVPVSHYTGLPNISVPIASYQVGEKTFPVSINYHARGIKVEEIASRTGIGWSLNAGGAISRQTRGQPDDGSNGYINRPNILMDALANGTFFTSPVTRSTYHSVESTGNDVPDRFPDQFNVSAGSLSAKFIFSYKDDEPLIQSFDDIIIDETLGDVSQAPFGTNLIKSFVITDKDGYRYYFGVSKDGTRKAQNWDKNIGNYAFPEQGSYDLTSSTFELIYNSWLLMDIESPNGELASFEYQEEISTFFRRSYDKNGSHNDPLNQQNPAYSGLMVNYSTKIESHQYQLTKITHSQGEIVFESSTADRQDLNGGKELDEIKIYDYNQNLVKSYELYQSYPNTVVDNNQNDQLKSFDTHAAKRMFLDSIVEVGKNTVKKPAHAFTYNSQELPHRFSNSQDLWGFYNGEANGQFLRFFGPASEVNRHVVVEKSMAGLLERITYPTGGSTKFIFEHNIGKRGDEYDNIVFPNVNAIKARDTAISFFDHAAYSNGRYTKDIIISNIAGRPLRVDVNLPEINGVDQNWACANPIQNDCMFDIKLEGINGNPYNYEYIFAGQQEFQVESGEYRLIVDPHHTLNWDPNPPNTPIFIVGLTWEEELLSGDYLYSAGKRIKKIEFYDSDNTLISQKTYSYTLTDGSESGVILSIPSFGSLHPDPVLGSFGLWQPAAAIPGSNFTTFQGNAIGYQSVTEYHGDDANNHGKTVYDFWVQKDTDDYISYPVTPPTDNEWLRGLPRFIKHYKLKSDGTYGLVKHTINEYMFSDQYLLPLIFTPASKRLPLTGDEDNNGIDDGNWSNPGTNLSSEGLLYDKTNTFYRLPLVNLFFEIDDTNNIFDPFDLNYKIYHLTGGTVGNFKSRETLYDANENPTFVTETETTYNYLKHHQPSAVTSVTSDGIPTIKTFTYPQELVSSYTIHPQSYNSIPTTALAEQHRIVPVKVQEYEDSNTNGIADGGELLSTTETIYDWLGGVLEPSTVKTGKGASPTMYDRVHFKEYDSDANLLQVAKAEGADISYIYGYNNALPVAKIENATYAQAAATLTGSELAAIKNGSYNQATMISKLEKIRTGLPDALVTTYTYDPLIGITSVTDPTGYTTYYEYDDLNRLKVIKDEAGKILSQTNYNYKN